MVAGQMDIGSGGVAPFIQAIDKGLDWKALGALNEMPLYRNCARPGVRGLNDLVPAVPPGSWGGPRPSMGDSVTETGATRGASAAGGCQCCLRS